MCSVALSKMLKLTCCLVLATVALASGQHPFKATDGKYHISEVQLVFSQAYATCKRYGLTLATERSASATSEINAALQALRATDDTHYIGGFRQIGGTFFPGWIWLDSGEDFGYTYWNGNSENNNYECLVKQTINSYAGNWTSGSCTVQRYFICESQST